MIFKYTRTSVAIIIRTFKKIVLAAKIFLYFIPLIWYLYSIYVEATTQGSTMLWYPITVSCLFIVFGIFDCVTSLLHIKNEPTKIIKRIYSVIKIILKAVFLGIEIFNIYVMTQNELSIFNVIITILSILVWIITVILEIITWTLHYVYKYLKDAFAADIDDYTSKFKAIKHIFVEETEEEKEKGEKAEKTKNKLKPKVEKLRENYTGLFLHKKKKRVEKE